MTTLTEKTQKLVQTASVISETLSKLDLKGEGLKETVDVKKSLDLKESDQTLITKETAVIEENQDPFEMIRKLRLELCESNVRLSAKDQETKTLSSLLDQTKSKHKELLLKSTRNGTELKAVLEQNELLRQENRKHIETEAHLRTKILSMSQPIDEIDPSVLVLRERVVQQALDLVKVNAESNRGKTVMQCFKNSVQVVLKLARLGESTQILTEYHDLILHIEKGIESFMKFTNDSGLADVEAIDISKEFQLYKKEKEIQIKDLQDEILQLKLESKSQGKKWSAKCDALAEKYKQLIQENEVLVAVERELIQENKHLEKLALKPDPVPEVVVVPPGSQELYKKEKQSQLERIGQLENHIANLEHAIDKWKLENESLQSDLQKLSVTRQQTDKDLQKAKQRATILQEQVKDEQLKNEKAAELIKQLQSRPVEEVDVPGEITRLELLLESQVKAFDQVSMPVGDDGSQIQVFQVMKSLNEKTSQITLLESQISELHKQISKSNSENQKQKTKLVNVKDKYEVREQGWLEKCKKLKAQVAQVTKESLEYQQVLNLYMDQFKTIQHMLENQEGNYAHPLSFSSLFQVLKERTDQISMQCTQLHNQLLDTKHQVEQTLGQLEYEKKKSDSLDHQQLSTIEKLEFLKEKQIEVEQRNKMLEHELQETIKQKQQLNKKFQLVIEKTAQFIQNEME